jgi:hypothetical protein
VNTKLIAVPNIPQIHQDEKMKANDWLYPNCKFDITLASKNVILIQLTILLIHGMNKFKN